MITALPPAAAVASISPAAVREALEEMGPDRAGSLERQVSIKVTLDAVKLKRGRDRERMIEQERKDKRRRVLAQYDGLC